LEEFETVFVPPPERADSRKAVNHVVQMQQSRCFKASGGKMGCISCHDPHVMPAEDERVRWYRQGCLNCHEETSCHLSVAQRRKQNAADSCIDCHMPRNDSSNIAHASITDHRVVRRRLAQSPDNSSVDFEFVPFHANAEQVTEASIRRDMGLSLAQQDQTARQAWSLLGPLVERAPEDVAAMEALGLALWRSKRSREALPVLEQVLQQAPRREVTLSTAALATLEIGAVDQSLGYWQRLLHVNPDNWESQAYYAQALAYRRQWSAAVQACRASLRLDPFETGPRMLLIDCLKHLGEKQRAQAEFDTLMALHPPNPEELRRWFQIQLGGL
jgi:tetratricopeptide (TPR) repeat protein